MKRKIEKTDCGVIVGRFQVDKLHDGHKSLILSVMENHPKVIIFLGLSPARVTRNNPLDFESRKQMILSEFPMVNVLYIKDVPSDEIWSKVLDEQITDLIGPLSVATLYGSRESFVAHYVGRYPTCELEQESFSSGSQIRDTIGARVKGSPEFREGVIWASYNQYPKMIPTIDIAIWDESHTKVLLAKKPSEKEYRFIGGFVTPGSLEENVRREVSEEAHIDITDPVYIGSCTIDDWRYRRELDKIVTSFFEATHRFGRPTPDDDIAELKWFDFKTLSDSSIVPEHRVLVQMLRKHVPEEEMK